MGKSNIIEINGKRYDARTGTLLAASAGLAQHAQSQQHVARVIQPTAQAPKAHTSAPKSLSAQPEPAPRATTPKLKVRVHDAVKASKQLSHRKTQPSKTLMRAAVSKPKPTLKRHSKAHGHTDSLVEKPAARLQTKPSVRRIDEKRLRRAQTTPKTQAVKRFSKVTGPAPQPPTQIAPPAAKPHVNLPHGTRPAHAHGKAPKHPRTTADILEQALQSAVSHQQIFEGSKRRRRPGKLASIGMVAAALTILGGFVAYHNVNDVKLHLASSKAGFTANLPDYQPAGYHLNHLKSAPGEVAINFRSNSDDRSYAVIEKPSAWNSEALRDSFLASAGHSYQTVDAAGRTLFLYGDNAATWVSGGIWYQVQSNGTLSNRQLIELATSM